MVVLGERRARVVVLEVGALVVDLGQLRKLGILGAQAQEVTVNGMQKAPLERQLVPQLPNG